jgi:peptidyl-prolyl cis-trans isomerase A (cyclophilin A)
MHKFWIVIFAFIAQTAWAQSTAPARPQVEFQTSQGNFVIELYPDKAPQTVNNFLQYIEHGFYQNTIFHRTLKNIMVQGGGLTESLQEKSTFSPIINESNNGLKNEPGTIAMARAFAPDSATSQFFINISDNKYLNYYKPEPHYIGYCVFGKVIRGMSVVERIGGIPTQEVGLHKNVPVEPIVIYQAALLETPVTPDTPPVMVAANPAEPKKKTEKTLKSSEATTKGKNRD